MSGHSKWAQIKRQKGAADVKRANLFTKLANKITIAAKTGNDPNSNPRLRLAIESAKRANMPKTNIERAIQRANRETEGTLLEEIIYEAIGPEGVGILITVVTDNRNRSGSEMKHLLSNHGSHLAGAGSVQWMFSRQAWFSVPKALAENPEWESLELNLIDSSAENIEIRGDSIEITTPIDRMKSIKKILDDHGVEILDADIRFFPKNPQSISKEAAQTLDRLIQSLHDNDNVTEVSVATKNSNPS